MSIYAVLSDIHANWHALQAVLADVDKTFPGARLWVLGDTVMYGPHPLECLREIERRQPEVLLMGNNDHNVLYPNPNADLSADAKDEEALRRDKVATNQAALAWTQAQLQTSAPAQAFLASAYQGAYRPSVSWPVVLVHASPCLPVGLTGGYINEESDAEEALLTMKKNGDKLCFMGHTHMAVWFEEFAPERSYENCWRHPADALAHGAGGSTRSGRMLINPGSVGQPRNNDPRAHYLLWDDATGQVTFRRVNYDYAATIAALEKSDIDRYKPATIDTTRSPSQMLVERLRKAE